LRSWIVLPPLILVVVDGGTAARDLHVGGADALAHEAVLALEFKDTYEQPLGKSNPAILTTFCTMQAR